jgi:hypothetical protein
MRVLRRKIRRSKAGKAGKRTLRPSHAAGIDSLKGGGSPLPPAVRRDLEPRFGLSFGPVRVHTDARAARTAKAINARAFTIGKDVVFGPGQYSPGTATGKRLLAHELTHVAQQNGKSDVVLQRQPGTWSEDLKEAQKLIASKNKRNKTRAAALYKGLILKAAKEVSVPAPLVKRTPTINDIKFSVDTSRGQYHAYFNPNLVVDYPNNYWRCLRFFPSSVHSEAWTMSAILHELDHAAHYKVLYDLWKKEKGGKIKSRSEKRDEWKRFLTVHGSQWTEGSISSSFGAYQKVELEGLPSSIEPSLIEFRAYVNQFVHFFHKLNIPKQEFLAKAVILFYPLKKQKVKGGIQDPSLDLVKARTQVINYFNNPPGNAQQKQALKRLICIHFQKLIILRPADSVNIERDFLAIFKSPIYQKMKEDRDLRKKVKKNHKPF